MKATSHVIKQALAGDVNAMRGLLIIMAKIAEPVIAEAIRINSEQLHQRCEPFNVLISYPASATASMAVANDEE
jgi:hypothetical protein